MSIPKYLRKLAQRCFRLSKTAVVPDVIEQMQVWTVELADEADKAERRDRRPQTARRPRPGTGMKRRHVANRSRVLE
jgi:hypothetical protein